MSDDIDREFQRLLSEVDETASQTKPSRESLREVQREAKERARQEEQRRKAASAYWAAETGRPRSRRRGRRVVAALAVVGVASAGAWWWFGQPQVNPDPAAAAASPAAKPSGKASGKAASKASPSSSPATAAEPTAAPEDGSDEVPAFSGTPARTWSVGVKGIVLPKPTQVGVYRPAQVADAYAKTRRYLVAAMLNPAVLYRGKLAPVLDTLSADSQQWLQEEIGGGKPDPKTDVVPSWTWVANRFKPGDWTAAAEIRINGKMSPSIDSKSAALKVSFTYIAAYWLSPRSGGAARTVAVRRYGEAYFRANGSRRVGFLDKGGDGVTTSAAVCGAAWPDPQFLQVWKDPRSVPVTSASPLKGEWNLADPDSNGPGGCFRDTSGF